MKQIVPGVYGFTGLMAGRVYLIAEDDGLTLIDAGLGMAASRIIRQLAAAGYWPQDVKRILITHAHMDHVGGLPALQAQTGAAVIASSREQPIIEGQEPVHYPPLDTLKPWERLMRAGRDESALLPPVTVDQPVEDGEMLPGTLGGVQVLLTPGHTPGHLAFWQPERRVLFCGDVLMHFGGRLSQPFAAFSPDMAENRRSIARLAALEPQTVCFGHGPALTGSSAAVKIRQFAARIGAAS